MGAVETGAGDTIRLPSNAPHNSPNKRQSPETFPADKLMFLSHRLRWPVPFVFLENRKAAGRGGQVLFFKVPVPQGPGSGLEVNHHEFALCIL